MTDYANGLISRKEFERLLALHGDKFSEDELEELHQRHDKAERERKQRIQENP